MSDVPINPATGFPKWREYLEDATRRENIMSGKVLSAFEDFVNATNAEGLRRADEIIEDAERNRELFERYLRGLDAHKVYGDVPMTRAEIKLTSKQSDPEPKP